MPVKPSPPPVTGLNDRRRTEPVLIMRGSDATPPSNCLALAWPSSEPASEVGGGSYESSGVHDDRLVPIAEQRKNHSSLVVSPSGQPIVRVQSSYQGFFTPQKFYSGQSPLRTPPTGGSMMTSTPQLRRIRGEEKVGSFISFSDTPSPARSSRALLTTPSYGYDGPRVSPLASSSRDIILPSSEKRVRFRGGGRDASPGDSPAGARGADPSPGSSGDSWSFEDMSTSSVTSAGDSGSWHYSGGSPGWSDGGDYETFRSKPSRLGGLCQRLCWWFATFLVIIILCINLSFVYVDYRASNVKVIPSHHVPLGAYLGKHLVNQPIAVREISSTLDGFLLPGNNQSSVVLSLHGGAGVGKSFTLDLIQEYYFGHDEASPCVSILSVPVFAPYETATVREKLEEWLRIREGTCRLRLFVLEDLHGYTPCRIVSLVREALQVFLRKRADTKQAVIITTNIAAVRIMQDALYNLETNVKGNLSPHKFRAVIQRSWEAIDEFQMNDDDHQEDVEPSDSKVDCGFTGLSALIDESIPFLPLERGDVRACVVNTASRRGLRVSREQQEWVADQLTYEPPHWPVYSSSGCKLVAEKFGLIHNVGEM